MNVVAKLAPPDNRGELDPEGLFCRVATTTVPLADVARLGKARMYGQSRPIVVVVLKDGRKGHLSVSGQEEPARRALNTLLKGLKAPYSGPLRFAGYEIAWKTIP